MGPASKRHAAALALGLCAASVQARADEAPSPPPAEQQCRISRVESLDVETLTTGEIAVPLSLNGKPYRLLVDTGSTHTAISDDVADQLGVAKQFTFFGGAFLNGVRNFYFAELNSMGVGHLKSGLKWQVLIAPDTVLSPTTSGLVGADVMANYDVEFDFLAGKMNFFAPLNCPHPVYWAPAYAEMPIQFDLEHHIVVDAWLDGHQVKAILDTGAPTSVMSLDAARDLFGWDRDDPRVHYDKTISINSGKAAPFYHFPFASLSFGGAAVLNPQIGLIPRENFGRLRRGDASLIIGMSVIRQLHLFVAYKEAKLFLTSAESYTTPPQPESKPPPLSTTPVQPSKAKQPPKAAPPTSPPRPSPRKR